MAKKKEGASKKQIITVSAAAILILLALFAFNWLGGCSESIGLPHNGQNVTVYYLSKCIRDRGSFALDGSDLSGAVRINSSAYGSQGGGSGTRSISYTGSGFSYVYSYAYRDGFEDSEYSEQADCTGSCPFIVLKNTSVARACNLADNGYRVTFLGCVVSNTLCYANGTYQRRVLDNNGSLVSSASGNGCPDISKGEMDAFVVDAERIGKLLK